MSGLNEVYHAVLAIAGIGIVICSAEYWTRASAFEARGPFAWRVLSLRADVPPRLAALVERAPATLVLRALLVMRVGALMLALAMPVGAAAFTVATAALVAVELTLYWRRTSLGADGADQMTALIVVTTFLCAGLTHTSLTLTAGVVFIAAQGCFSYFSAGVAKLVSSTWRSGFAVALILNTGAYGTPETARALIRYRWLSPLLSWTALGAETAFPLVLVAPDPWRMVFLAWGAAFHAQCAVLMGLNTFLWAFVATYPAILFTAALIAHGL